MRTGVISGFAYVGDLRAEIKRHGFEKVATHQLNIVARRQESSPPTKRQILRYANKLRMDFPQFVAR
jgi:hypothetical protein